ncbi:MAG: hypothetical protein IJS08_13020 [Victivallales bacterium]|nr:hypothetical protein [Victivallales bacterium]
MTKTNSTPSNHDIKVFIEKFSGIIDAACESAGMPAHDRDLVINIIAYKYSLGKIVFSSEYDNKESTYIYRIAYNAAIDEMRGPRRQNKVKLDDNMEDNNLVDMQRGYSSLESEDECFVTREALNRLALRCDKRTMVILVRYGLGEKREDLAKEYKERPNYISLVKNHWGKRYDAIRNMVLHEDEEGTLKLSPDRIDFLKPYLEWL